MQAKDIMNKNIISLVPSTPLQNAAMIFYKKNFHTLPIVLDKKLVGIITEKDFMAF